MQKANNAKHSKTKLPWFRRLLPHLDRKRGELILQHSRAHPTIPTEYLTNSVLHETSHIQHHRLWQITSTVSSLVVRVPILESRILWHQLHNYRIAGKCTSVRWSVRLHSNRMTWFSSNISNSYVALWQIIDWVAAEWLGGCSTV